MVLFICSNFWAVEVKPPSPLVKTRVLERNLSAASSQFQASDLDDMPFIPENKQESYLEQKSVRIYMSVN